MDNKIIGIILSLSSIIPRDIIYLICNLYVDSHTKYILINILCNRCNNCKRVSLKDIKQHVMYKYPRCIEFSSYNVTSHHNDSCKIGAKYNYNPIISPIHLLLVPKDQYKESMNMETMLQCKHTKILNYKLKYNIKTSSLRDNILVCDNTYNILGEFDIINWLKQYF